MKLAHQIVADYSYFSLDIERIKLDNMFVHSDFIEKDILKDTIDIN